MGKRTSLPLFLLFYFGVILVQQLKENGIPLRVTGGSIIEII